MIYSTPDAASHSGRTCHSCWDNLLSACCTVPLTNHATATKATMRSVQTIQRRCVLMGFVTELPNRAVKSITYAESMPSVPESFVECVLEARIDSAASINDVQGAVLLESIPIVMHWVDGRQDC